MPRFWVLLTLAGLLLAVNPAVADEFVFVGILKNMDPTESDAITIMCEKSDDGRTMTCDFTQVGVYRKKTPEAAPSVPG